MPDLIHFAPMRFFTSSGAPANGWKARFYDSGTTTPKTVYTTSALTTAAANPLVADSSGTFTMPWSASGATKCVISDANDTPVLTIDPCGAFPGAASAAGNQTFDPTGRIAATTTQAAIEEVDGHILTDLQTYGLGVTGNNQTIASLDATTNPSRLAGFNSATTGTFPTGVTAADTGIVAEFRRVGSAAVQMLFNIGGTLDVPFVRKMTLSAWAAWREIVAVPLASVGDMAYRTATGWARLAVGTTQQVLGVTGGIPAWQSRQPTIATVTASGTAITFTGLTGWDEVRLQGIVTTDANFEVQLSTDGSTWRTTGYLSHVHDGSSTDTSTTGVIAQRSGSGTYGFNITIGQLSTTAKTLVFGEYYGGTRRGDAGGYYDTTGEVHTAVRLIGSGGTANFTAVNVKAYGVR